MFCSQCGRKLGEGMLFCPFCGAEIVIPEQDESGVEPPREAEPQANGMAGILGDGERAELTAPEEPEPWVSRSARRRAREAAAQAEAAEKQTPELQPEVDAPSEPGPIWQDWQKDEPPVDVHETPRADMEPIDVGETPPADSEPIDVDEIQPVDSGSIEADGTPRVVGAPTDADETPQVDSAPVDSGEALQDDSAPADADETPRADRTPLWADDMAAEAGVESTGEPFDVEPPLPETGKVGDIDWRSAFDDWLRDVPDAPVPQPDEPRPERQPENGDATAAVLQPDRPRHRPAEGEAVPVRRRSGTDARKQRGRRARQEAMREPAQPRRPGRASLSGGSSRGTVVPRRRDQEEELFLSKTAPTPAGIYADYDEVEVVEERPSFFFRHLRSMVGLILLAALAFIIGIYAVSDPGQTNLAKLNLAWRPEVYSRLGRESYNVGRFQQAGAYYEQALRREPDNYSYASSAAKCYLDGKDRDRATAMLKRCIELMPTAEDPYIYLQGLYPDPVERPLEITQLLQQGYQMTGSERLREAAENAA